MQKITVLCVGKLKEKFYQEAAAEYAKRLGRHCKLEIIELPESRLPEDPSAAEIQRQKMPFIFLPYAAKFTLFIGEINFVLPKAI